MEHSLFLRQYRYEIAGSQVNHQPVLRAFFDFESGNFKLEGDGQFIRSNNSIRNSRLNYAGTRLLIDAVMKPEIPAGPHDNLKNELLLCLKGMFYTGRQQFRCSGLLQLNRNFETNNGQWMIYCNLIDNDLDFFEIKLKVPVFTSLSQTPGNN